MPANRPSFGAAFRCLARGRSAARGGRRAHGGDARRIAGGAPQRCRPPGRAGAACRAGRQGAQRRPARCRAGPAACRPEFPSRLVRPGRPGTGLPRTGSAPGRRRWSTTRLVDGSTIALAGLSAVNLAFDGKRGASNWSRARSCRCRARRNAALHCRIRTWQRTGAGHALHGTPRGRGDGRHPCSLRASRYVRSRQPEDSKIKRFVRKILLHTSFLVIHQPNTLNHKPYIAKGFFNSLKCSSP